MIGQSNGRTDRSARKLGTAVLVSVIIGVLVFAALSVFGDIGQVSRAFAGFRWNLIFLVLASVLMNYFLRFGKWDFYLRNIGVRLKPRDSLTIFLCGLTMSVTPGKLGEVFKSYLLKKLDGTEVSRSVPVVIAERITDGIGLLVLVGIALPAFPNANRALVAVPAALLALVILIIKSRTTSGRLIKLCGRVPGIRRLSGNLQTSYESAYTLFRWRTLTVAVVISTVSWGFECLATYFILQGFGAGVPLLLSVFIFAFSTLAGVASMLPGGFVVTEGSLAGLLMVGGLARGLAASATVMIRICTLWFAVIIGLVAIFSIRERLR